MSNMADNRRTIRPRTPHFFKLLIPGFLSNFRIPTSFLKHLGFEESTNDNDFIAVLMDPSCGAGNGESESWFVQVDSDGRHFLNGWKKFAHDHSLSVGEFIVFKHLGGFEFEVVVFDPISSCPRSFSAVRTRRVKSKGEKKSTPKKRFHFQPSGNPYFRASVRKYCSKWCGMLIPIPFARENGLIGRSCEVEVIDQINRRWFVDLKQTNSGSNQILLSSGWVDLARANRLEVGDKVVYELINSGSRPVMKFYKES